MDLEAIKRKIPFQIQSATQSLKTSYFGESNLNTGTDASTALSMTSGSGLDFQNLLNRKVDL